MSQWIKIQEVTEGINFGFVFQQVEWHKLWACITEFKIRVGIWEAVFLFDQVMYSKRDQQFCIAVVLKTAAIIWTLCL